MRGWGAGCEPAGAFGDAMDMDISKWVRKIKPY
jgi:hypothetical protein